MPADSEQTLISTVAQQSVPIIPERNQSSFQSHRSDVLNASRSCEQVSGPEIWPLGPRGGAALSNNVPRAEGECQHDHPQFITSVHIWCSCLTARTCLQPCRVHLIILPSRARWLKSRLKRAHHPSSDRRETGQFYRSYLTLSEYRCCYFSESSQRFSAILRGGGFGRSASLCQPAGSGKGSVVAPPERARALAGENNAKHVLHRGHRIVFDLVV